MWLSESEVVCCNVFQFAYVIRICTKFVQCTNCTNLHARFVNIQCNWTFKLWLDSGPSSVCAVTTNFDVVGDSPMAYIQIWNCTICILYEITVTVWCYLPTGRTSSSFKCHNLYNLYQTESLTVSLIVYIVQIECTIHCTIWTYICSKFKNSKFVHLKFESEFVQIAF